MKTIWRAAVASLLFAGSLLAQDTHGSQPQQTEQVDAQRNHASSAPNSSDIEQMRADLERLKVLLNQMRTNLAFVQTSQTPLKHQFELETDAWQVIVEQMDRRLRQMEERRSPEPPR